MLVEHKTEPYVSGWLFTDAQFEFVASAAWVEERSSDTTFNGPSCYKVVAATLCAESDSYSELRQWAIEQIRNGAAWVNLCQTWLITSGPERLIGKRDNKHLTTLKGETQ